MPNTTRSGADRALSIVAEPSTTNDASSSECVPLLMAGSLALQSKSGPLAAFVQLTPDMADGVSAAVDLFVMLVDHRELSQGKVLSMAQLVEPERRTVGGRALRGEHP